MVIRSPELSLRQIMTLMLKQYWAPPNSMILFRIAAIVLLAYWTKDQEHVNYWVVKAMTDVVFEFLSCGTGSSFDLAKFGPLICRSNFCWVFGICFLIL